MRGSRLFPLLVFAASAGAQDRPWVLSMSPPVDSAIKQVMDTAFNEPAFCLGVDADAASRTIEVWSVVPATITKRGSRDRVHFSCPTDAGIAHGHFLERGHKDGPAEADVIEFGYLRPRPPIALIVVRDRFRKVHYRLYATPDTP